MKKALIFTFSFTVIALAFLAVRSKTESSVSDPTQPLESTGIEHRIAKKQELNGVEKEKIASEVPVETNSPPNVGKQISNEGGATVVTSNLVFENAIHQQRAIDALSDNDFSSMYHALRMQPLTPEQTMRNHRYKSFLVAHEGFRIGGLTNDGIECGQSLCLMNVGVYDEDAWESFSAKALQSADFPIYSITEVVIQENGRPEHRLLFSIDPEINGITGF